MFEVKITMNQVTDRHEIRYHDLYSNVSIIEQEIKSKLWEVFKSQVMAYLVTQDFYLIRFLGYHQEGDHDLVLEYSLKAYDNKENL